MAATITGKRAKIDALPFSDSSMGGLEAVADRLELRPDLVGHIRRLHPIDDVSAHRDGGVAIDAPKDRLLVGIFDLGDLRQRDGHAVMRIDRQVADVGEVEPFRRHGARHDFDFLYAVADCRDRHARNQHAQRFGNVLRRHAERPHPVLVDDEAQIGSLLVPVKVRINDLTIRAHDFPHAIGDVADLFRVRPDDAELHREADRRTEIEPVYPHARFRQRAAGDGLLEARLDPFACLDIL
jgi:hypothetical protein